MATVYKRGEKWWGQWYLPGGKRVARNTGSTKKRDAQRIADEMEAKERKRVREAGDVAAEFRIVLERAAADAQSGKLDVGRAEEHVTELLKLADPSFRVVSLERFLTEWCADISKHVGDSTASGYGDMKRRFAAAFGPKICKAPVGSLTRAQVKAARHKIVEMKIRGGARTIRASTANLDLRALRRALGEAVNQGLARVNAAGDIRPLPEDDSVERAPFEAEEVRRMMDHEQTGDEWRGMILFGAHTGLRLTDVSHLGREQIEGTDLVIRPKKTKRSRKTIKIPLTPPLLAWIKGKKGHFFPILRTKRAGTLSTTFKRLMAKAEVPAVVTLPGGIAAVRSFHSLRHSFTTWLAEADIHADIRQKLTGHSSAGVHAKYTHHDAALDRAIMVLPDFGAPEEPEPPAAAEA